KAMQEVASLIFEGAMAFLNRQYRTIALFALVAAVIIGVLIGGLANDPGHGVRTAIAFLVGAFCSGLAGFIGMFIAVQVALRPGRAGAVAPRRLTWARTSWARSRRPFPRTIPATRQWWPTWSGITSAIALAVVPTCSSRPPPRTSGP